MRNSIKAIVAISGLLICSARAQADPQCDNGSLQGNYAVKAQGEVLGTLDAAGLHPFAAPQPINSIAQVTFFGNGTLTREDFTVANGAPQVAQPPNNGPVASASTRQVPIRSTTTAPAPCRSSSQARTMPTRHSTSRSCWSNSGSARLP